jgi:hypothetical protein
VVTSHNQIGIIIEEIFHLPVGAVSVHVGDVVGPTTALLRQV